MVTMTFSTGHNQRKIRHQAIQLGVLPEQDHTLSHAEWAALPVIRLYIHGLELGVRAVYNLVKFILFSELTI